MLIAVGVAAAAACLPIFLFLGYRMLRSGPTAVAIPAANSLDEPISDSAPSSPVTQPAPVASQPAAGLATAPTASQVTANPVTAQPSSPSSPAGLANAPFSSANQSVGASSGDGLSRPSSAPPSVPAPPVATEASLASSSPFGGEASALSSPKPAAPGTTREVVHAVEPSVVVIEVPGVGLGSGFALDNRGTIVTNYHVIEGAKTATVKFLTDGATFPVQGFLVIAQGKDLAILKIDPGSRPVTPLPLAGAPPEKGESVLAFGAPKGFGGSVSDGIVSSVRSGTELRDLFQQGTKTDIYTKVLGYDLDAVWIQTTAPISGGNSGGPLVNLKGEAVGLNTWNRTDGQNLNFAISADHVRTIMQSAQSGTHPLSELPAPRKHAGGELAGGDGQRTLEYWLKIGDVNRKMFDRLKKIGRPPLPNTAKSSRGYYAKMAVYYRKLAEVLPESAAQLKDLNVKSVDPELILLVTADAMMMESIAEDIRKMAISADLGRRVTIFDTETLMKKTYGGSGGNMAQAFDILRLKFNVQYGLNFPSVAGDSAKPKTSIAKADDDSDDAHGDQPAPKADDPEKAAASSLKLAKSMLKNPITRDAGAEKLAKIVADYPGTKAAEEAKKLLIQFGPAKK